MDTPRPTNLLVFTCAAGRQAKFLLPRIYGQYRLRLVVRSDESRARLHAQYPEAEVVCADLAEPAQCTQLLRGASHVFHIGPSLHEHELEIGLNMVDAATHEAAQPHNRFQHFVYSSVLNTQFRKMYNHDRKRYVEEYLFESPLNYTVLNPGDFLNMAFPVSVFAGMPSPHYQSLMGLESRSAFVVLEDYAEACEKVLAEGEKHYYAQYQMVSMPPIAYGEVAQEMARQFKTKKGVDISISLKPYEEAVDFLLMNLFGDPRTCSARERDGAERLMLFYRRRGLQGNPNTMAWLLGRPPTSHADWIAAQLDAL